MDIFLKNESTICPNCNSVRNITVTVKTNVLIELVSLPKELEISTSVIDINMISEVHQNYAGEIMWALDEIPKTLNINSHTGYIVTVYITVIWYTYRTKSDKWSL
ncbi:unnamed protein product [Macrosiphum euphorbiae]|uniref:Uncharacterized protein n=1 Tax=Macrosiphum euphorbiae TaxID=13131 RepID=A0AAV0WG76_9HEMI|nr:unnamed protein product [Macrosiphum euphorbiae]